MRKRASSQASWSLLSKGVNSARVEAHVMRSALNQMISALDKNPQVKEAVYKLCGDNIAAIPKHLSNVERELDTTSYALISMGDAFYRQRLTHEDRELVDQASKFNPTPEPTIVRESKMRRMSSLAKSLEDAKNLIEDTIEFSDFDADIEPNFQMSRASLEVSFADTLEYDSFDIAHMVYENIIDRRGNCVIEGLSCSIIKDKIFLTLGSNKTASGDLYAIAENFIEESTDDAPEMLFKYKFIRGLNYLEVRFFDTERKPYRGAMDHEYITYTAADQAYYLWESYLFDRRGNSRVPGLAPQIKGGSIIFTPVGGVGGRRFASQRKIAARFFSASASPKEILRTLSKIEGVEDLDFDDGVVTFVMDKFENKNIETDVKAALRVFQGEVTFEKGNFTGLGMVHINDEA